LNLRPRPVTSARAIPDPLPDGLQRYLQNAREALAAPFTGVTTDGGPVAGLFPLRPTGVSTAPIRRAAEAFLGALGVAERAQASFAIDSEAWRQWSNIHPFLMRHGVVLDGLAPAKREAALDVLRAALSERGFTTARDVMKLNEHVGELTGRWEEYGEWLYWLSVMGTPSDDGPWGWQIDGHHLIVNCLVLGDQVVMTPMFMGSEPVAADDGPLAGTRVFEAEERRGLDLARALTPAQRRRAVLASELPGEVFTAAFRDNFEMKYEGIRCGDLSSAQQGLLLELLAVYVGRIRAGHAEVRLTEVRRHLADTCLAWMGGIEEDRPFYYRLHSPVILIEFDHQRGIVFDNDAPSRHHIHTVVRTPNGNDYGHDLLRQHHARFDHARADHRH
jgi:uncharacterized protein DUF3500